MPGKLIPLFPRRSNKDAELIKIQRDLKYIEQITKKAIEPPPDTNYKRSYPSKLLKFLTFRNK